MTSPYVRPPRNKWDVAKLSDTLDRAAADVYEVNEANGWYEDDRTVGDDIALLHSEVSEAFEAYRDGGLLDQTGPPLCTLPVGHAFTENGARDCVLVAKPEGFGSECADILIRLLDTCKRRDVDLAAEFERKLAYNRTRGHKHGGKLL